MKFVSVLIVLALWIGYQRGEDTKAVPKHYHTAINFLYLVFMIGAAVTIP